MQNTRQDKKRPKIKDPKAMKKHFSSKEYFKTAQHLRAPHHIILIKSKQVKALKPHAEIPGNEDSKQIPKLSRATCLKQDDAARHYQPVLQHTCAP
jgi:hypothetical protein